MRWVVRSPSDRLLDPACGDGRFLVIPTCSEWTGIPQQFRWWQKRSHATVYAANFFDWAKTIDERFDCVAGNPPFIRYQQFNGEVRKTALQLCSRLGAKLTGLTSSWAPFVIVSASLLTPGGRLAFVVPAEIGHAPYAQPVIRFLLDNFSSVHVVAVREKVFPALSEDIWFDASGFGQSSDSLSFSSYNSFRDVPEPLSSGERIDRSDLKSWNDRLRPFLLPRAIRDLYVQLSHLEGVIRLETARALE